MRTPSQATGKAHAQALGRPGSGTVLTMRILLRIVLRIES
jgi:hypothetical protein